MFFLNNFGFFIAFCFASKSPAANGGVKPTTVVPAAAADSTASRGTADVANPVVTGHNPKKSQTKKTKRGKNEDLKFSEEEM